MGTLIEKTSYDLGLMVAANMSTSGVPIEVQEYYLSNRHLIPEALRRGFTLPQSETQPIPTTTEVVQDINWWLAKTQEFTKKFLGVEVDLRDRFAIPAPLPWRSIIPIFDPGTLTNRDAIKKTLKASGLAVGEEVDVMKYSGAEANKGPALHFIQNSIRPDEDTMGMSPDQLVATGKNWLDLRGYALAFSIYHFATGQYLDPQTFTWFPNTHLSSGEVASGYWYPVTREVRFRWNDPGYRSGRSGSRLAIPATLVL